MSRTLYFLLLSIILPTAVEASHLVGGSIRYENVQDSVFDFYLTFYRNCRGTAASNPSAASSIGCVSSSTKESISLTLVSISEISRTCKLVSPGCMPKNTTNSGNGWEEHVYKTRIDFRKSPYNNLMGCGDLYFLTVLSGRPSDINTGSANTNYAVYTTFDPYKYPSNSSPTFRDDPRFQFCCNRAYYLDYGAVDTDGDSLSYKLITPKKALNSDASWGTGYSETAPVKTYNPGGSGIINPNTIPPRGFYMDPEDGFIVFSPTNCGDVSTLTIELTEWRKDTSGTYQKVSVTIRENYLIVGSCTDNYLPQIDVDASYGICEGDSLEIDISTSDQVFSPPPPTPKPDPDTVVVSVLSYIDGATFKTDSDTALFQSGTFSWRPKKGDARSEPYRFTVIATDNNCPYPATYMRRVSVFVKEVPASVFTDTLISCGTFLLNGTQVKGGTSKATYTVLNDSGTIITDRTSLKFSKSGGTYSTYLDDTLTFFDQGTFIIRLETDNDACKTYFYDTIYTSGKFETLADSKLDVCSGVPFKILVDSNYLNRISAFNWTSSSGTSDSASFEGMLSGGPLEIKVESKAMDGCVHLDSIALTTRFIPDIKKLNDSTICKWSPAEYRAIDLANDDYKDNRFTWNTGDSTSAITIDSTGIYQVTIENLCGSDSISFNLSADDWYSVLLDDEKILCDSSSTKIGVKNPINGVQYEWSTSANSTDISVDQNGTYYIVARNACGTSMDSVVVFLDHTPDFQWADTMRYCEVISDVLNAYHPEATYVWSDGSKSDSLKIDVQGNYSVAVTTKGCGKFNLKTYVKTEAIPVLDLGSDTLLKKPFTLKLDATNADVDYQWSTGSKSNTINIHDFGVYWVKLTNVCGEFSDTIEVGDLSGIEGLTDHFIAFYPNPNRGIFVLDTKDLPSSIKIISSLGQAVNHEYYQNDGQTVVRLDNPVSGIYYIEFVIENQIFRQKFVVAM